MWGLPLEDKLTKLTRPLKNKRGLLIVQGQDPGLAENTAAVLEVEEIAECASHPVDTLP